MKTIWTLTLLLLCACRNAQELPPPQVQAKAVHVAPIDYNRDIRPLLSDKCFYCHGPDASHRKADLRLDTPAGAYGHLKDNDTAFAIVAGKSASSEAWLRICSDDEDEMMPPRKSNKFLTAAEKATLKRWIDSGAKYDGHWAFQPLRERSLPAVTELGGGRNAIDRFVLARLDQEGLPPAPEADRITLLRRLSLDLTGLPPSREEIQAFVNDQKPDAYERQVERLLASPAYGEHMAMGWMDIARYSDTDGFQHDRTRTMWP